MDETRTFIKISHEDHTGRISYISANDERTAMTDHALFVHHAGIGESFIGKLERAME